MGFRGRLVLSAEIADDAVDRDALAPGAVGSTELDDLAVIAGKLADSSLDRSALFAGAIVAPEHIDHLDADLITAGTMAVEHLAAGTMVAGRFLQSANYDPGVAGWQLDADGDVEAQDVTARGVLTTGPDGTPRVTIDEDGTADTSGIYWTDADDEQIGLVALRPEGFTSPGLYVATTPGDTSPFSDLPVIIEPTNGLMLLKFAALVLDDGVDPITLRPVNPEHRLDVDSSVYPAPGIGEDDRTTQPTDYPNGLTVSPTVAGAQGWPLSSGARSVVLTVKSADNAGWQLIMDDNDNTMKARAIDHNDETWHAWQDLN